MSDRFVAGGDAFRLTESFQLDEIPHVDVEKFDTIERAAVERVITEQQESLIRLQTDVLEVRTERDALDHRLTELIDDRERLQDRVRELEAERPALEPKAVFANLGAALEAADEDLSSERYRVDDVDFTLKANLTQTADGVRMHLPSLDESSLSANLSEISFRLRAPREIPDRPETEYVDVPELRGLSRAAAVARLTAGGLTLGTVEHVPDPTTTPGAVVEQFPDGYTVTEPGASVDLILAEAPEDQPGPTDGSSGDADADDEGSTDFDPTTDGETESDEQHDTDDETGSNGETDASEPTEDGTEGTDGASTDRLEEAERERMEAFRRAIITANPETGPAVVDRLRRAGVTDLESLVRLDPNELAKRLSIPVEQIVALQERLGGGEAPRELESISGIGPTYATRLREKGIETVTQLSALDAETVAEITKASTSRAADWIEQAAKATEDR